MSNVKLYLKACITDLDTSNLYIKLDVDISNVDQLNLEELNLGINLEKDFPVTFPIEGYSVMEIDRIFSTYQFETTIQDKYLDFFRNFAIESENVRFSIVCTEEVENPSSSHPEDYPMVIVLCDKEVYAYDGAFTMAPSEDEYFEYHKYDHWSYKKIKEGCNIEWEFIRSILIMYKILYNKIIRYSVYYSNTGVSELPLIMLP